MHVLIPAGGRGVRLRPLTNDHPKPLLPLGDRPILTHMVDALPLDFQVVVVVTPELEPDFRRWQQSLPPSRNVRLYVEQPREKGLAGPVVALADCIRDLEIRDDLLVMMGDSVLPFTIEQFLAGKEPDALRLAAYPLPSIEDATRFGVLEIAPDDTVSTFEEKPAAPRSRWVFTGCLHIPRELVPQLQSLPATGLTQMGHLVSYFMGVGRRVTVFRASGEWHDIGTFASYLEAHRAFETRRTRELLTSSGNRMSGVVYVHPSATVAHSRLSNCIVFDGAEVNGAELTNCVVHARVRIADRIVRNKVVSLGAEYSLPEGEGV